MADQRIRQAGWANETGYVDIVYDDVTLAVSQIIYANPGPRGRVVEVYRLPQDTVVLSRSLAPGTPETAVPAPNNLNLVADAEGSLSLDRFRIQTRSA